MDKKKFKLFLLPEKVGICHLDKRSSVPGWAIGDNSFLSITRTENELSIVCPQDKIPGGVLVEKDWRVLKVEGPLGFVMTGIVASLSKPLAEAGISILYISAYETDHLLVEETNLARTIEILSTFCQIKN